MMLQIILWVCLKIWCSQIQYHHFSHSEKQQFVEYTIIYHIFRSTPIYLCFSEIFSSCVKLCSHFVPVLPPGLLEVPATLYNQRHPEASATAVIFPQCLGCHGSPPLGDFLNWGIPMSPQISIRKQFNDLDDLGAPPIWAASKYVNITGEFKNGISQACSYLSWLNKIFCRLSPDFSLAILLAIHIGSSEDLHLLQLDLPSLCCCGPCFGMVHSTFGDLVDWNQRRLRRPSIFMCCISGSQCHQIERTRSLLSTTRFCRDQRVDKGSEEDNICD